MKTITDRQRKMFIELLWDSLKDSGHRETPTAPARKVTGWGTKTETGLIACIERIIEEE